jgi:hypothetical protein
MSLRNSRSSDESAIEFLSLLDRENRFRKRETADGGAAGCISGNTSVEGLSSVTSISGGFGDAILDGRVGGLDDVEADGGGGVATLGGVAALFTSTLLRGDALDDVRLAFWTVLGVCIVGEVDWGLPVAPIEFADFLPKNESSPPLGLVSGTTSIGVSVSGDFHPFGMISSCDVSGRDLMDVSQAVDPFADMK